MDERPEDVTIELDRTEGISPYDEPELYDAERAWSDAAFARLDRALEKLRR